MIATAYLPKILHGTELAPSTKNERISARGGCSRAMWGDKFWLRGSHATLSIVNEGSKKDPGQAEHNY